MTQQEIKLLKYKIEIYKHNLYKLDNLEVDLIYGSIATLIRMKVDDLLIARWLHGIENEIELIIKTIEEIENKI